ncbi:hypothetical protein [Streptacidiphilus sp. MAP5-3]|uniref:SCO3933 family regulatory protein n=1 Tax=unclassified Streptacidiphilus TaxID=2643834 RepID=UPI0035127EE5
MRFFNVDTSNAQVLLMQNRGPKLKNRETGEIATDRDTGATLMVLDLAYLANGEADVLTVTVPEPGIPADLMPGMPVRITGLIARPWENPSGHGIAFRAVAVAAAVPANSKG